MWLRIALDADRLLDVFRGDVATARWLGACEEVCVPRTVLRQLQSAFSKGAERERNEVLLQRFLAKPNVRVLEPDQLTRWIFFALLHESRGAWRPWPEHALWFAAFVMRHGLDPVSREIEVYASKGGGLYPDYLAARIENGAAY